MLFIVDWFASLTLDLFLPLTQSLVFCCCPWYSSIKDTWEDKFFELVEDLQRAGVRPEGIKDYDTGNNNDNGEEGEEEEKYLERYLKRMKDAYDRGELKSWVEDIDVDNLPKVPSKNRDNYAKGFGNDFAS